MGCTAEHGATVVLSSHPVCDLERVCDHLVVLATGRVQLAGDVDELVATHHRLIGPYRDPATLPAGLELVSADHTDRQSTLIVRSTAPIDDPTWTVTPLDLEDLVLSYMSGAVTAGRPLAVEAPR